MMTNTGLRCGAALGFAALLGAATLAGAQDQTGTASPATRAAHAATARALPPEGTRDARDAQRGFLTTRKDPVIRDAAGKPVWNLDAYAFVSGTAPETVNPSLWRHMTHLKRHGLFQVTPGIWQVRGFDVSNMTIIKGQSGWIVIDPLTSVEAAQAAMALVDETLGKRPVTGLIYSHSHGDHFGGARGVIDAAAVEAGKVPDALLKKAQAELQLGRRDDARRSLGQLIERFPDSDQARQASALMPTAAAAPPPPR